MKEILILLAQSPDFGMYRTNIIHSIEKEEWMKKTKKSSIIDRRVLVDSVRVSYDRTLAKLKRMRLIEGGWSKDVVPLSPYMGTLWSGQCYTLTAEGKRVATEIIQDVLKQVLRFNQLILNGLDDPY